MKIGASRFMKFSRFLAYSYYYRRKPGSKRLEKCLHFTEEDLEQLVTTRFKYKNKECIVQRYPEAIICNKVIKVQ